MRRFLPWFLLPVMAACGDSSTAPPAVTCPVASGDNVTGTPLELSVGQSRIFSATATEGTCLQIDGRDSATYVLAIYDVNQDPASTVHVTVHGGGPGSQAPARVVAETAPVTSGLAFRAALAGVTPDRLRAGEALHRRLLRVDRDIVRRRGGPRAIAARTTAARVSALRRGVPTSAIAPKLGDTITLHVRDINVDADCTQGVDVRARTVYVGTKSIITEDVDAPLAGTIDDDYTALGQRFDDAIYPMLVQNFGDPLAWDAQLGNTGKVIMLFSPVLNDNFSGVAGFVSGCDFFPYHAQADSLQDLVSNEAAIFYALVPKTTTGSSGDASTLPGWRAFVPGLLAHESKHLASYAAKLANNAPDFEEPWLEEATAQTSSEIYQRTFSHTTWKGNGGWTGAIGCEQPLTQANGCAGDHPLVMLHHFSYLYDYLASLGTETPIGDSGEVDYGGAWSFVRWAVDQYATDEGATLKAITQTSDLLGVPNLEARTGGTFGDMVGAFALASALPLYPGVVPQDPHLRLPSWDQAAIFSGMHDQLQGFDRAYPVIPVKVRFGLFDTQLPVIHGGGAAIFEVSGLQQKRQGLYVRTTGGDPLPADSPVRVAVIRVR
ncbi:MAG TPA: hypothetical protein VF041_11875 [Gemmatimonadaceae bacterium]